MIPEYSIIHFVVSSLLPSPLPTHGAPVSVFLRGGLLPRDRCSPIQSAHHHALCPWREISPHREMCLSFLFFRLSSLFISNHYTVPLMRFWDCPEGGCLRWVHGAVFWFDYCFVQRLPGSPGPPRLLVLSHGRMDNPQGWDRPCPRLLDGCVCSLLLPRHFPQEQDCLNERPGHRCFFS